MSKVRFYATGRRKTASARVWLHAGSGVLTVNGQSLPHYFKREVLEMIVRQPFGVSGTDNQYDATITVKGGGLSGQADAVRHGLSRALALVADQQHRTSLKRAGFLTRDAREVERKKYGLSGARKRYQYSKR